MSRFNRKFLDDDQFTSNNMDERYDMAFKRVKRIKGFYVHLMVYILFNAFIIVSSNNRSLNGNEVFFRWETFSTALFWGIGLVAHAASVFGKNLFFGKNWEERKIQEFMEKDKEQEKKWE
jgi:hypothetical protein